MLKMCDSVFMLTILMFHEMSDPFRIRHLPSDHLEWICNSFPLSFAYANVYTWTIGIAITMWGRKGRSTGDDIGNGYSGGCSDVHGHLPPEYGEVLQDGLTGRLGIFNDMTRLLSCRYRRKTVFDEYQRVTEVSFRKRMKSLRMRTHLGHSRLLQ